MAAHEKNHHLLPHSSPGTTSKGGRLLLHSCSNEAVCHCYKSACNIMTDRMQSVTSLHLAAAVQRRPQQEALDRRHSSSLGVQQACLHTNNPLQLQHTVTLLPVCLMPCHTYPEYLPHCSQFWSTGHRPTQADPAVAPQYVL